MGSSIQIEEEAAAWLVKRDGGDWTETDQAEFTRWLARTPNRVAFIRLEGAWQRARRMKVLGAGSPSGVVPEPSEWRLSPFHDDRKSRELPRVTAAPSSTEEWVQSTRLERDAHPARGIHHLRPSVRALVASVLISALAAGTWFLWPVGTSYRTPVGGLASVPMGDGSNVTLNTDSEIRVAVTDTERRVELEQGEAFFEVAKDPKRPFVVAAGGKRVIAVGTKFSVRRYTTDIGVVVTEGQVRLEDQSSARGNASPEDRSRGSQVVGGKVLLSVGAIARAGVAGIVLQQKPLPEAEEALSWRAGYLVFRESALADAVAEFNRYNERKLIIQDPEVAAIKFSGNLRSTNFEGFVRLLEEGFAVQAQREDDKIVLTKN